MMRVLPVLLVSMALLTACGDTQTDGVDPSTAAIGGEASALMLQPELDVRGVDDAHELFEIANLAFESELFLLPVDGVDSNPGAVVAIRVQVDEDGARTETVGGDLTLERPGRYQVLLRVRPDDAGISVTVDGTVQSGDAARGKATSEPAPTTAEPGDDDGEDEPAPTPAEPAPTPAEPAPTPAEPAPTPAEPAPTPAEPAPTPADEAWGESGDAYEPVPDGEQGEGQLPPRAEPAPTPAEPAPTPARAKPDSELDPGATSGAGAEVSITSRRAFEFYVGVVDIDAGDTELLVGWDVRPWLSELLAEPLGLAQPLPEAPAVAGAFQDIATYFELIAR